MNVVKPEERVGVTVDVSSLPLRGKRHPIIYVEMI